MRNTRRNTEPCFDLETKTANFNPQEPVVELFPRTPFYDPRILEQKLYKHKLLS